MSSRTRSVVLLALVLMVLPFVVVWLVQSSQMVAFWVRLVALRLVA